MCGALGCYAPLAVGLAGGAAGGVLAAQRAQSGPTRPLPRTVWLLERYHVRPLAERELFTATLEELRRAYSPTLEISRDEDGESVTLACGERTRTIALTEVEGSAVARVLDSLETLVFACRDEKARYFDYHIAAVEAVLLATDPEGSLDRVAREMGPAGTGMSIALEEGVFLVNDVFAERPADRAGLRVGDRLVTVDGADTSAMRLADVVERLRGPDGSTVSLGIERDLERSNVVVARERIRLPVVTVDHFADIGYVHVRQFDSYTAPTLREAWSKLRGDGVTRLILDLRRNYGGSLLAAAEAASLFLEPDSFIAASVERICHRKDGACAVHPEGGYVNEFRSAGTVEVDPAELVVLVDGRTAGSAEMFAAAVRARERTQVLGSTTQGREAVLHLFSLSDEYSLRFRVGTIYLGVPQPNLGHAPIVPDEIIETPANSGESDPALERAMELLTAARA
jgi:carboxyl-terminal processing protease